MDACILSVVQGTTSVPKHVDIAAVMAEQAKMPVSEVPKVPNKLNGVLKGKKSTNISITAVNFEANFHLDLDLSGLFLTTQLF